MHEMLLRGSMTERVFPEIDNMLRDEEFHRSVHYIKTRQGSPQYRTTTDLVFCELAPQFKEKCRKYYRGKGPELRATLTEKERDVLVFTMKNGLVFALLALRENDKKTSWLGIRKKVDERISLIKQSTR